MATSVGVGAVIPYKLKKSKRRRSRRNSYFQHENNIENKYVYLSQCVCGAGSARSTRYPCACPLLRAHCLLKVMPFARKSTSILDTKRARTLAKFEKASETWARDVARCMLMFVCSGFAVGLQCACSVLQCVAVCCSVLLYIRLVHSMLVD